MGTRLRIRPNIFDRPSLTLALTCVAVGLSAATAPAGPTNYGGPEPTCYRGQPDLTTPLPSGRGAMYVSATVADAGLVSAALADSLVAKANVLEGADSGRTSGDGLRSLDDAAAGLLVAPVAASAGSEPEVVQVPIPPSLTIGFVGLAAIAGVLVRSRAHPIRVW